MEKDKIKSLLYTIYSAGFNHGINENTFIPEHGTFDAFNRLLMGESPLEDGISYDIKDKIDNLLKIKTAKIKIESIKDSDGWMELAHELKFEKFKTEHSELDEDELSDKFYDEVVSKKFQYGEFADIEIEVDENFNIVGGKII